MMRYALEFAHSPRKKTTGIVFFLVALIVVGISACVGSTPDAARNTQNPGDWRLIWSDEFDAPDGSVVDPAKWTMETGGWGWGNNELETYTNRLQNVHQANGSLVITVEQEKHRGLDNIEREYTSARLNTKDKFSLQYGRFEARLKLPYGPGLWPAFWLLGSDVDKAKWPHCGEIDIMENVGKEPEIIHCAIHGPGYSGANGPSALYNLANGQRFADDYHTFTVEWDTAGMRFYCDGHLYKTMTPSGVASQKWVFDHPFFIILNVAVGGNWPGRPDKTTIFPQQMLVDYVRVYQRSTN